MKIGIFTDIHWGAKNNSAQHNEDCADYIDWLLAKIDRCDKVAFLGDWFEQRNSINVATLNASLKGMRRLNDLQKPIFFITGNHDLYHRDSRAEISTEHFKEFSNIQFISETTIVDNMMFVPYIFKNEYPDLVVTVEKIRPQFIFGHFEFTNFVLTGSDRRMEGGLNHTLLSGPAHIISGHFHKRQANDNIVYIGNTFPSNYGDVDDDARGAAILDTRTGDIEFFDWAECPKYRKVRLSAVLNDASLTFPEKCRVKCSVDTEIGYSEAQALREEIMTTYQLREFVLEENSENQEMLEGTVTTDAFESSSIDDAVIKLLQTGITDTSTIEISRIIDIYQGL